MLFVELRFFVFAAVVFAVTWTIRTNRARKFWLLGCSYAFYAGWDWRFLSLIWISTVVDYLVGRGMAQTADPRRRRQLLFLSLGTNLGLLGFFKYFGFFVDSAVRLSLWLGFETSPRTFQVVLPVGISFYTFQTISYSIDVYRGRIEPTRRPLDFALFVAFFPQLVAGPIVRARDFLPQLLQPTSLGAVRIQAALGLFLVGFFKKACVSDNVAPYVDAYFANPGAYDWLSAWIATLLYAIQIYCDFSGYSDMAIACAALLGYRLCVNFAHPYFALGFSDFWRRWHISLSQWLRAYLYIPLGGNRHGRVRTHINLMITMLLGGLWHGAAWNFVVWGAMHGAALAVERELRRFLPAAPRAPAVVLGMAFTFWWVCATWIVFRAPDFATAWTALQSFVAFVSHGPEQLPRILLLHVGVLAVLHVVSVRSNWVDRSERIPAPVFALAFGIAIAACIALVDTGHRPFIYFRF
jgi:alginate O-acetyltransferase complex protein AlgI